MRRVSPRARVAWTAGLSQFPTALARIDDRTAAVGLADGRIVRYEVTTGAVLDTVAAHRGAVLGLAAHPREPILASTGDDGAVRLHRGTESVDVAPPDGTWAEHVAWSPAGKRLAASKGRVASVWSLDGQLVTRCAPVESTIAGLAWSRDSRRVAAACYGGVRLLDPQAGLIASRLDWKGSMLGLAWSDDGRFLASGMQDGTVHFWRMPKGKDSQMAGYPYKPTALAWSADSRWLATGGAPQITLWPFDGKGPEGREPVTLDAHTQPLTALAFAPQGRLLASGCRGGSILLWDVPETTPVATFAVPARVEAIAWLGERVLATTEAALIAIEVG